MTDEQWQALRPFAEAQAQARLAYINTMAFNTPTDPRKRIEVDIVFEQIRLELIEATKAFEDARKRILGI